MNTNTRKVSVIVLCWNKWSLTKKCLETIKDHTNLSNVEIVVVNNGSTDETEKSLKEIDWIRVINLPENLGFVRGNNKGIESVDKNNDILLLNNDIEILKNGWIEGLSKTAYSSNDIGIVGCRLLMTDGRLLHAGTYIPTDTFWGQQIGSCEPNINQYSEDREVQGIVFACAYIKREVIEKIGMLSEDYESYFEDTDYCLRAKEIEYKTFVAGGVTLLHHEHGSTSDCPAMFNRLFDKSRHKFIDKWANKLKMGL